MPTALRQICTDCGYVYDPEENGGIPLVDRTDWECPGVAGPCGATADKYEIVEPESSLSDEDDESDLFSQVETAIQSNVLEATRAERAIIDLARMYDDKELILQPDWQRYYVWSNKQASQLVESLFLRLPIPLIYLAEEQDGTFTVVDGQQRLTALIEFIRNKRVDPRKSGDVPLTGLEVLTDLNGKTISELSPKDQKFIKNQELSVVRLKAVSDPDLKLTVFRRLNTGSVKLNAQELRNAAFRGPYNDELKKWARNTTFLQLTGRTEPDLRMLDVEMVLRFCAWLQRGWTSMYGNLGDYLDREMEFGRSYKTKELSSIGQKFKNAVELSFSAFGPDRVFRRYIPGDSNTKSGFWETRVNKAVYDVVMFGFTRYPKAHFFPHLEAIRESLVDLMATDRVFQEAISQATSDTKKVNYRFTTWLARIDEIVGDDPQKRTFSRKLKKKMYDSDPTCVLCDQEIMDMDDAHVHHIEHYWRGGKTIPENAGLTHRFCNLSEGGGKA